MRRKRPRRTESEVTEVGGTMMPCSSIRGERARVRRMYRHLAALLERLNDRPRPRRPKAPDAEAAQEIRGDVGYLRRAIEPVREKVGRLKAGRFRTRLESAVALMESGRDVLENWIRIELHGNR